jgi:ABC-type polar amino acid transport system ATPase subunit
VAAVVNALDVRGLAISRGSRPVVQDLSFSVEPHEVVALMGASGSGKTTVLRAIVGLEAIAAGRVTVGDVQLAPGPRPRGVALRALHRRVGMVFQFHHLFEHMSALQNIALAPVHVLGDSLSAAETRARTLLEQLGIAHRADAKPRELSGGEAQRVAIARALAMEPPVLLLDEPTASLDPERREALAETLRRLAAGGRAILLTTHDTEFAASCALRVVTLAHRQAVPGGAPAARS